MTLGIDQQQEHRESFPPQRHIRLITPAEYKASLSSDNTAALFADLLTSPLTEENLAIHTIDFPASKDARRLNCENFVESQMQVIEMEKKLQQQREKEISSLEAQEQEGIEFSNPFHDLGEDRKRRSRKSKWFSKLKHWIRIDDGCTRQNKTRHLSWSAGTEKEDHKVADNTTCQKRDSGISIFSTSYNKRRSTPIATTCSIPFSRQPKPSPSNEITNKRHELITYQYPKMRRKSSMIHTVTTPAAATSDASAAAIHSDHSDHNKHAVEKFKISPTLTASMDNITSTPAAL